MAGDFHQLLPLCEKDSNEEDLDVESEDIETCYEEEIVIPKTFFKRNKRLLIRCWFFGISSFDDFVHCCCQQQLGQCQQNNGISKLFRNW